MMVYLITKQLKCPLQRSSNDEGHVVRRSYGCLSIAPCGEAYTRAASARIVRSEDGHPLGWPLLCCSLSPVAIRTKRRYTAPMTLLALLMKSQAVPTGLLSGFPSNKPENGAAP